MRFTSLVTQASSDIVLFIFLAALLVSTAPLNQTTATAQEVTTRDLVKRNDNRRALGRSTIRGRVIYSDTRRPLRRATVSILDQMAGGWVQSAKTNRRGEFEIMNLGAGQYYLSVDAAGILTPAALGNTYQGNFPLILGPMRQVMSEVVVDGTNSVDVQLEAVRGGVITGRVVTEEDQPVANVDVRLFRFRDGKLVPVQPTWNKYITPDEQSIKTDPDGVYRIAGLPSGEYIVRVSEGNIAAGRSGDNEDAYSDGSLMIAYYPNSTSIKSAQPVSVSEGSESTGIDIRLPERESHMISGAVTLGPENRPGSYTEVIIVRKDEGHHAGVSLLDVTVRANDQGRWEVHGVPDGEYLVRFGGWVATRGPDGSRHTLIAPKTISVRVARADVIVNTNVTAGAIVFGTIKIGSKTLDNHHAVTPGVIPVNVAEFERRSEEASPTDERVVEPLTRMRYGYGSLKENGSFEIIGISSGRYWFSLSGFDQDKYYIKSVTSGGIDLMSTPITLAQATDFGPVTVTVGTDLATLEGSVLIPESVTKKSFKGVVVVFAPATEAMRRFSDGVRATKVDSQGRFNFKLAPGEYFVTAFLPARMDQLSKDLDAEYFKQDKPNVVRIKVQPSEKVKGLSIRVADK